MNTDVIGQVAALPSLKTGELQKLWQELFAEEPPKSKRDYLIPRLAWRIQELAYGGLPERTAVEIERLSASRKAVKAGKLIHRPVVGTRLIREHQGVEHQVTVTHEGFEYQGRTFRSLSEIARVITGTRWSGPVFFGIKGGANHGR